MREDVKKYFENLEHKNVDFKSGMMYRDGSKIIALETPSKDPKDYNPNAYKHIVDSLPAYCKEKNANSVFGIASSIMYNDNGILVPQTFPLFENNKKYSIISQDVNGLMEFGNYEVIRAEEFLPLSKTLKHNHKKLRTTEDLDGYGKYNTIIESKIRNEYLELMTEECLEDLNAIMLIDEVRADSDRHFGNFFLYKKKGADKFEGIIPIDLECSATTNYGEESGKEVFETFLKRSYNTCSPNGWYDGCYSYQVRLNQVRHLITHNKLTPRLYSTLKKTINYDLPGVIRELGKKYGEHKTFKADAEKTYETTSLLWEYNNNYLSNSLNGR